MRVLILGGTGEARSLAALLVARRPALDVVSSLAGRTAHPRLPAGRVRVGGFGDVEGLADYLRSTGVQAVVDATHPFAARITANAASACARRAVPLVVLRRPGWTAGPDDDWHRVASIGAAAAAVAAAPPGAVLLTVGRRELAAFAADDRHDYVIRSVDPPEGTLPPRHTVVLGRGPFAVDAERRLLRDRRVTLLVTKDSGGELTAGKLVAARAEHVPVVVVDRPRLPEGVTAVPTVEAVARWLDRLGAPPENPPEQGPGNN